MQTVIINIFLIKYIAKIMWENLDIFLLLLLMLFIK